MNIQAGLLYTEHDEWVQVDGDVITVGITDFAQDQLGEIVHVELPAVGRRVAAGDAVCEVESVKAVAEVYAPVGGEVIAVNDQLDGGEDAINSDPYGTWMFRIRADAAPAGLLDSDAYRAKIG
ncbi:MAG TPA: glycine cleavage system protein GcvH [Myxococcota bacterium]|nr:glycine cleavage system protein GcvH [Myxococcota bacterium]